MHTKTKILKSYGTKIRGFVAKSLPSWRTLPLQLMLKLAIRDAVANMLF